MVVTTKAMSGPRRSEKIEQTVCKAGANAANDHVNSISSPIAVTCSYAGASAPLAFLELSALLW